MADVATATPKSLTSAPLASPKLVRNKSTLPASTGGCINASFGCNHIEEFHKAGENSFKTLRERYEEIIQVIRDKHPIVLQTCLNTKNVAITVLRPTFLCVQCPFIYSEEARKSHLDVKKHSFCCKVVNSRNGTLYCSNCEDYVYDPLFETIRLDNGRKRKFDEFSEDSRSVPPNSTHVPCRAIGLRGLYNMGNTCFMSAVIQSLLHNPLVKSFFLTDGHKTGELCEHDNCLSCSLDEIFTEFFSLEKTEGYGAVTLLMNSWKTAEAQNSELAGYKQQDAHEYMQFLINALHVTNGSLTSDCHCFFHETFYGCLRSDVICDKCNNKTTTDDPFLDLSLDLRTSQLKKKLNGENSKGAANESSMRLEECLKYYTSKEKLAAVDYTCKKCATQGVSTKQFTLLQLPPVLSIHLKRFSHLKDKSSKVTTPVKFPLVLDMMPYTTLYHSPETFTETSSSTTNGKTNGTTSDSSTGYSALLSQPREHWSPKLLSYDLATVIVHKGEMNSGHYVNYSREGKQWFLFDDSKVVLATEAEVLRAEAYILTYVVSDVGKWVAEDEGDGDD
ncbi:cysteine proteinase [Microthyrium microscopicum]|uniref:ubiquitinyl hydrolase 1 n=1 Tax=Microthyrium microscopicum TaxID=703497 RepID=A0A6A6U002_9PEZI|nr:cysteine proteinase [Microthyrium microscopicum]